MKRCFCAAALAALAGSAASAATVDSVGWLRVAHGFAIEAGQVPAGIEHRTVVSGPGGAVDALIDDPAAAVVLDAATATAACAVCLPPEPAVAGHVLRTNRADPTQFALAQHERRYAETLDPNALGVFGYAVARSEESRETLAQVRIGDPATVASAGSTLVVDYRNDFENTSSIPVSFGIRAWLDAELTARSDGPGGVAGVETRLRWLFAGADEATVQYVPLGGWTFDDAETGPGAAADAALQSGAIAPESGFAIRGVAFSASATAAGGDVFTEATVTSVHEFTLRLTLQPGQFLQMFAVSEQSAFATFAPAPVPVPATLPLMLGGLAALAALRRTRRTPMVGASAR